MGRTALLVVLGLGLAFNIFTYNLHKSNASLSEKQMDYVRMNVARNLARSAVHMVLRAYDRGENPSSFDAEFNNGVARAEVTTSGDTMWMSTEGVYEEKTYPIELVLMRGTKPFPNVNAAAGIRVNPVDFKMSGSPTIDGRNWNETGTALVGTGDLQGVSTMTSLDSSNVINEGGSRLKGSPPVKVDTTTADPLQFVNEYIVNADYTYGPGTYSSLTWGSSTNPVIVVCATPDTLTSVKFTGNVVGWGVLVVRGNLEIAGNFKFHGLVIVYGEDNIVNASAATGTPDIIGGLILAGAAHTSLTMKGTSELKYSSESLEKAKNIGKLRYYSILDWYE